MLTVLAQNFEHCLGSEAMCVHPNNGNTYVGACLKEGGVKQHFVIWRISMSGEITLAAFLRGGGAADAIAQSQITQGSGKLRPDGSMLVSFSCIPKGDTSGRFKPVFLVIANVDEPWAAS